MSEMDPITPQQIVKLHNLSQSIGQQCPHTEGMLQIQARAHIKKLKARIAELDTMV